MTKLFKYLKPFAWGVLLAFALLFGQAICDLNLPNLMSDIVNVGIQQSGIEQAAPRAISQNGMSLVQTFMDDAEKELVNSHYTRVKGSDTDENGNPYDSMYPGAKDTEIYIKQSDNEELDHAFGVASWTFIGIVQDMAKQSGQDLQSDQGALSDMDMDRIYTMAPLFAQMGPEAITQARDKAVVMDEMMLKQSGIAFSKGFYKELGGDIGGLQADYILRMGGYMLLMALAGGVATVLVSLISSKIAAGVARNLRKSVFYRVGEFSNAEFDQFSTASLITRTTNDITQVQQLLTMGIRMICYAPIMAVGGVVMSVQKSASMAWIIALACVILLGVIMVVFSLAMPKFKAIQKLVDKLNLVSREGLSGLMVIRAFGTEHHEKERFDTVNEDLTRTNRFVNRVMVFMMPCMMLIMNGISILVVWTGAHQIADAAMQVGDMMAFIQYAMQVIMSFLMISIMFIMVPRAAVSMSRIAQVLEMESTILDPENQKAFDPSKKGLVEFKNVDFRYAGAEEDALQQITFTARPGETTAFIGSTGSGKSTIANLIMRLYDVTAGTIMVNGTDVRDVAQKDLRAHIGFVPQKGELLSGTIASNLRYGNKDATEDQLREFAKVAQAIDFIDEKPEGLNEAISQGGTNVSGGQKQRLSIARALAKKPDIFIFDDSFSALDFKTDASLRAALKEFTGESTVLVVAQRISTIRNAEQIIVLDQGQIVGCGRHEELMKTCEQYYEIASSQLSKEELS